MYYFKCYAYDLFLSGTFSLLEDISLILSGVSGVSLIDNIFTLSATMVYTSVGPT